MNNLDYIIKSLVLAEDDTASTYNDVNTSLLRDQIFDLNNEVQMLRQYNDKYLDEYMLNIQKEIKTYQDAYNTYYTYDSTFFDTLPFSQEGKRRLASMLVETIKPWLPNNNPIWLDIINDKSLDFQ